MDSVLKAAARSLRHQYVDDVVPCPCGVQHPAEPSLHDENSAAWRRLRARILKRDGGKCQVRTPDGTCGKRATVCGHILARAFGGCDRPGNLRAECDEHSRPDGASIGHAVRAARNLQRHTEGRHAEQQRDTPAFGMTTSAFPRVAVRREGAGTTGSLPHSLLQTAGVANVRGAGQFAGVSSPGPGDAVWDATWWLEELRDVPANATWPRLMTLPHPEAVDTYGREVVAQFAVRTGAQMRWWQKLAVMRLLEHDEEGHLVWVEVLLTLARQCGKSWLLRELILWRVRQVKRWGPQNVLHTAKDLDVVFEVMSPILSWAETQDEFRVMRNNNHREMSYADPGGEVGRWVPKAYRSVYGWSGNMACADEGWAIPARAINDGVLPTLVEQTSPQLLIPSTAHPQATGLVLDKRASAIGQLRAPVGLLLLDWSAAPGTELDDRSGWRQASPYWSRQREYLIGSALDAALNGGSDPGDVDPVESFRCQWLNQWPHDIESQEDPDERVATVPQWVACLDSGVAASPRWPLVVAVEDDLGRGAAAAAAGLTADGRVVVGGYPFPELGDAVRWAEQTAGADGVLLVGASVIRDPEVVDAGLPAEAVGGVEFRSALPALRALIRGGRLAHDGSREVSAAVTEAKVRETAGAASLVVTGTEFPALLRCVAWAAHRAHMDRL